MCAISTRDNSPIDFLWGRPSPSSTCYLMLMYGHLFWAVALENRILSAGLFLDWSIRTFLPIT